jgi:hypothetical protein
MPIGTKYVFVASMDVAPEKEALFNEVYDKEHVPELLKVPGVRSVTRMKTEKAFFMIAGERKEIDGAGAPSYIAIYEIDSPEVLTSAAWAKAVEVGRWASQVRPYTSNRHHALRKVVG